MFGKLNIVLLLLLAATILSACSEASTPDPTEISEIVTVPEVDVLQKTEEVSIIKIESTPAETKFLCGLATNEEYVLEIMTKATDEECRLIEVVLSEESELPLISYGLEDMLAEVELGLSFTSGNSLEYSADGDWTLFCNAGEDGVSFPLTHGFTCDTLPHENTCGLPEEYLWLWDFLVYQVTREDSCQELYGLTVYYGKISQITKHESYDVIHIHFVNGRSDTPWVMDHNGEIYPSCPGWHPEKNEGTPYCKGG